MSAPIRVEIQIDCCWWQCQICGRTSWVLDYPAELAAASDDGRAHLAAHHTAQMPTTPVVQTIVSNTRCTCGDLPRPSYPYFSPCPVHSYVVNTTNQLAYSRRCGVPIAACGADTCHCVPVDPDAEKVAQNAACDFGDDFPCCTNPMQRAHNESREGC